MKIWSPAQSEFIPLQQVTMGYDMRWEDPIIVRKNRKRTLRFHLIVYALIYEFQDFHVLVHVIGVNQVSSPPST